MLFRWKKEAPRAPIPEAKFPEVEPPKVEAPEVETAEPKAPEIDGWFHPAAAAIIADSDAWQKANGVGGSIVEIGLWHGKSFVYFAGLAIGDERVVGFDIKLVDQLHANVAGFPPGRCVLIEGDSTALELADVSVAAGDRIRMFHVDGLHTCTATKKDLALAFNTIAREGVVMLDDFFSPTLPGVTEAALVLYHEGGTNGFVPFALGGGKCFFAHRDYAEAYKSACTQTTKPMVDNTRLQDVMGGRPLVFHFQF